MEGIFKYHYLIAQMELQLKVSEQIDLKITLETLLGKAKGLHFYILFR